LTIENQVQKVTVNGNGVATTHSFSPMVITAAGDIVVTHVTSAGIETIRSLGTGALVYAVVVSSFPGTGSIRYPEDVVTPLPTGEDLILSRALTLEQQTLLIPQGKYDATVLERALDRGILVSLQQQELIDRCFKIPISTASFTTETLAPVALRFLRVNAAGTGVEWAAQSSVSGVLSDATPQTVVLTGPSSGASADVARADHSHQAAAQDRTSINMFNAANFL